MKKIIILNKKEGETPLEALENFRRKNRVYKDVPITYAGRLDPMASGLLLVLAGEKTKQKEKYLRLTKEYNFTVLFGFSTDTYDILGKINHSLILENTRIGLTKDINKNLKNFRGKFMQKYPIYSSRTVRGRPLFDYARKGEVVEVPKREVKVSKLEFKNLYSISRKKLREEICKRIYKVNGDFRQEEIKKLWRETLRPRAGVYYLARFHIKCGSGTYVRSIANSLGESMAIPALAYLIKRTKIGKWAK